MPLDDAQAAAFVDAAAAMLGLPIDPAHRPGVVANTILLTRHARLVLDFPIDDGEA